MSHYGVVTEAQQTMALRRATGMPVLDCREAVRRSADRSEQLAYLRSVVRSRVTPGTSWVMPDSLRDPEQERGATG